MADVDATGGDRDSLVLAHVLGNEGTHVDHGTLHSAWKPRRHGKNDTDELDREDAKRPDLGQLDAIQEADSETENRDQRHILHSALNSMV